MNFFFLLGLLWALGLLVLGAARLWRYVDWYTAYSLPPIWRMYLAGCFKGRLSLHPLRLADLACVEPVVLGGHTVMKAREVSLDVSLLQLLGGKAFTVTCKGLWVSWASCGPEGQSRLLVLLQHFGFLSEAKTGQQQEAEGWEKVELEEAELVEQSFTGQFRFWTGRLMIEEGKIAMGKDLGLVVGDNIDLRGTVGMSSLAASGPDDVHKWAELSNVPAGIPRYPLAVKVTSDNLSLQLKGWRTTSGLLLKEPLQTRFKFTPALAKHGLGRVSPLLATAVGLKEGSVQATLTPLALHLPAERYTLRFEPMQLSLAMKGILPHLIRLLKPKEAESVQEEGSSQKPAELQAMTTALEAEIHTDSTLETRRFDMRLGLGQSIAKGPGLHVAIWGKARGTALDMTLGIPGGTLGLKEPDYMFTVPVRGTSEKPAIDWIKASKQLAGLWVKERVTSELPFLNSFLSRPGFGRLLSKDKPIVEEPPSCPPIPDPISPLPWLVGAGGMTL